MFAVPWARSTIGVVLPGFIATYGLTLGQAGLVSVAIEAGSVTTMLALAFWIDRWGAGRVAAWGLPVMATAITLATFAPSFPWLMACLALFGVGMAFTSSGVNAALADTGPQRSVYLGFMHAGFSLLSIITPVLAGIVIARVDWQPYYWISAGVAVVMLVIYSRSGIPPKPSVATLKVSLFDGMGGVLRRIATVLMGVFCLVGMQGILMTWSYLYLVNQHSAGHTAATFATSAVWCGILIGRWSMIWLSRHWTARWILLSTIALSCVALLFEMLAPSMTMAFVVLMIAGIGVSGAYQLGAAWAAERAPERIGAASTFIMGAASLGIGALPWGAGAIIEATSFGSLPGLVLGGLVTAALLFGVTRK